MATVSDEHPRARPPRPSTVTLPTVPAAGVETMLAFFVRRFPAIAPEVWEARFAAGKVWCDDGPLGADAPYRPQLEVHYLREVAREPAVRRDWRVVWSDEHLMVVDKPPFLPVTPGGRWVRHCLLHLLLEATGEEELTPLHRLDRLTSGLVVLSRRRASRAHYAGLFQGPDPRLDKGYVAVCEPVADPPPQATLADHLARSAAEHWRQVVVPGRPANAFCHIELVATAGHLALYSVTPATGRKHQIRVQLSHAGLPILGDPLYGRVRRHDPDDLDRRLWLDASRLAIRGFPGFAGSESLDLELRSSRDPAEMLSRALE